MSRASRVVPDSPRYGFPDKGSAAKRVLSKWTAAAISLNLKNHSVNEVRNGKLRTGAEIEVRSPRSGTDIEDSESENDKSHRSI
jgi:hypothetical protein